MSGLGQVNKFETNEYVWYFGNEVRIIEWKYNTDTDVIRYHVENKQNGFKAWVLESQLSRTKPDAAK